MITKWSELPMGKFEEIQKIDDADEGKCHIERYDG